jgi:hypothetical protein
MDTMTLPVPSRRTPLHRRLGAVLAAPLVMLVGGTLTPAPGSAAPWRGG